MPHAAKPWRQEIKNVIHNTSFTERKINRETAMRNNREAHALGQKLGITSYLVDVTEARNTDSVMDSYNFAYSDMPNAEDIDKTARVALLVNPDDTSHDFIETVARNAGLSVTKFTDRELAISFIEK